jgi:hypothetical protein
MSTFQNRAARINDTESDEDVYEQELQDLEQDITIPCGRIIKDRQNLLDSMSDRDFRYSECRLMLSPINVIIRLM